MRILVTGSREWDDMDSIEAAINAVLLETQSRPRDVFLIHGGARGADTWAGRVAKKLGLREIIMPANWEAYGKAAGPLRNNWMLDLEPNIVLAFHPDLKSSRGTRHCVEQARRRGIPVRLHQK